jgi:putative flavoprotein involved in K+ transport
MMEPQRDIERIDTVVIGAGQAGLSAGYHLARRGRPFVILDADARVGDHWRQHWDSLRLFTPAGYDGLPGMHFPAKRYHWPSGTEMADYLAAYAARFDLPVVSGTRVQRVRAGDGPSGGFVVEAGDRRFEAANVIVAPGPFGRPHVPEFAAQLDPGIRQMHSSEYRNPSQLADGPVLVVGVSHSGADIAYEVAQAHRTLLSGAAHGEVPFRIIDSPRARVVWPIVAFVQAHVLTIRTPMGRAVGPHLRAGGAPLLRIRSDDLARAGVERHEAKTTGVSGGAPVLADGQVLNVANVIWCTGFRPNLSWVAVPGAIGDDGWPVATRGVVESVPGLYVLGMPFTYAFSSMLVGGAGRDAAFVVARLTKRSKSAAKGHPMTAAGAAR